jgi:hypothetical protein
MGAHPSSRSIKFVEPVSTLTSGETTRETARIGRATRDAMRSGAPSPIRFGTSSPMMSERYVMAATTRLNPRPSA